METRSIVIAILLILGLSKLNAQAILESYLEEGVANNLTLQQKQLSYDQSLAALREARGLFFPTISLGASYTRAGGGRSLQFPVGDLINPIYETLNAMVGENKFPTDVANVHETFLPNNFHETRLRLVQPLFNSDIYFNRKIKEEIVAVEKVGRDAYAQELKKEIKTAYFDYLQTEEVLKVYAETETLLQEVLRVNKRLVENDKATYDVIYRAERDLSELRLDVALARKNQQTARSFFNFLLNRSLSTDIEIDPSLVVITPVDDLDQLEAGALQRRLEIRQLEHAQSANARDLSRFQYQALPRLNFVLDAGFQGFGYTFDSSQDFWLAQLSLEWDIFKGFRRKAQVEQARIQGEILNRQQQSLRQQIRLQVQEAWYSVEAAEAAISASEDGLKSARQSFRIIARKYQEDQASMLDLTDARTNLTNAQLSLAISTYAHLRKLAELEWATGKLN